MSGNIFVISAPSGTGKTTVIKRVLVEVTGLVLAVSSTTRKPREGEVDGIDYRFVTKKEFDEMIKKRALVEWATVHGNLYGTPRSEIENTIRSGANVLLDVDIQGAGKVKDKYPTAILIFLLPPSFEELKKRLKERGANSEEEMRLRLKNAEEEYAKRHDYDYQIVNDDLNEAVEEIKEVIIYYGADAQTK